MRLVLVWQADPAGVYAWLPEPEGQDAVVSFDALAAADLARYDARCADALIDWEQRSAATRQISRLVARMHEDEALAGLGRDGYELVSFIEYRIRGEFAHVLRGFGVGEAMRGCRSVVADPDIPAAIVLGVRAGLGLGTGNAPYTPAAPPATPPPLRRLYAGVVMRALAAATPSRGIRIAAVLNANVARAVEALPRTELRAAGLAAMPFPGLDYGNSARLAAKLRIPFMATLDPLLAGRQAQPPLRQVPDLGVDDPYLAAALSRVTSELARASWPAFTAAAQAVRKLDAYRGLRALLLPTTAVGVSRVLIDWARRRGVVVAAVQHGIYGFKEYDGGDSRADLLFAWSDRVREQTQAWPEPHPRIVSVGVPGMSRPGSAPSHDRTMGDVLIATTGRPIDSPLAPSSFHEQFIEAIAPGVRRLMTAGVRIELRLHPAEDQRAYRRILESIDLPLAFAPPMPFPDAANRTDLLVCAPSSVAFEAASLGTPLLLWAGGIPLALREEHLLAPLSLELPGMFADSAGFDALVSRALAEGAHAVGGALAAQLGSYAAPFDAAAFGAGLRELAA